MFNAEKLLGKILKETLGEAIHAGARVAVYSILLLRDRGLMTVIGLGVCL